jgi:hypothetical protein
LQLQTVCELSDARRWQQQRLQPSGGNQVSAASVAGQLTANILLKIIKKN